MQRRCAWAASCPPCLLAVFLCAALAHAAPLSDARGKHFSVERPAQRVITLSPHLAELVAAIGASAKLVAVSRFTDYPAQLTRLPQIGDAASVDAERVLALRPDLVLAWQTGNRADHIEKLERLGLRVYVAKQPRLRDIAAELRAFGALLGVNAAAEQAARDFERALAALRARYAAAAPVSVFVSIWSQPPITVSAEHWIDEVVALCGGRNIFAQAPGLTPTVAMESIYRHNPQVIIGGGFGGAGQFARAWSRHSALRAVRSGRVHYIDPDWLQRPTARLLSGARELCAALDAARSSVTEENAQ